MTEKKLTTIDNPFDPFDEPDRWLAFDTQKGYNTLPLIARMIYTSDEESPEQQMADWNKAIDDIMEYCDFGLYKVVEREVNFSTNEASQV